MFIDFFGFVVYNKIKKRKEAIAMNKFEVANHEPSYLPDGKWKLVWADEFDGTELDTTKWGFRLNYWGKPGKAYTDKGVVLDGNSHIELHRTERDGYYVSPQLQTGSNSFDVPVTGTDNPWGNENEIWKLGILEKPKFEHRFGYYECRCKFQNHPEDMWSAFWTQSASIGTRFEPEWCGIESDIMECFVKNEVTSGNIMNGYGKQFVEQCRIRYPLEETADGWHYFGMDWQPDGYVFYCDGKETARCSENVSLVPQFILLTTEVQGYRRNQPRKVGEKFIDDAFIVDFVRVFDKTE